MRFLVDAPLPKRLAQALTVAGHETLHSSERSGLLDELLDLFDRYLTGLVAALAEVRFVELNRSHLIVHKDRRLD